MNNNYESVADLLKKEEQKNIKPVKIPRVRTTKVKKPKTKQEKKFLVRVVALIAAGAIAIGSTVAILVDWFKKKNNNAPKTPNDSIVQIDDMGSELEFPENNTSKYGNTTGNINVNDLVEKDGKIYKDKESADKSDQKGNTSFDNKNNTLVEEDGKIKDKNENYEIKDESGNVIEKGDGIPDGYNKVEGGNLLPEGYIYSDATYYDNEGNVVLNKGEVVAKETLENAKKYLTTTKPENKEPDSTTDTSSKEETTQPTTNEGKLNEDGTYTIFGLTFRTKADFEQWVIQGYEGYAEYDGVMMPEEEILKQIQKTK